jgi:NADPH-dependent curcumin reductase CurA
MGKLGWQIYTIVNSNEVSKVPYYEKSSLENLNRMKLCWLAGGAVCSIVCQLSKINECTVIVLSGSDKKCNCVTSVLGISAL